MPANAARLALLLRRLPQDPLQLGDIYLVRESQKKPGEHERVIPISWFARFPQGKKAVKMDSIMTALQRFAPQIFIDGNE